MAELVFTVDSALFSALGEKLVESAHIALAELVNIAYEADATEVGVRPAFTSLRSVQTDSHQGNGNRSLAALSSY